MKSPSMKVHYTSILLLPEVVNLNRSCNIAGSPRDAGKLGLVIEGFGDGAVLVREATILGSDVIRMLTDIAEELIQSVEAQF